MQQISVVNPVSSRADREMMMIDSGRALPARRGTVDKNTGLHWEELQESKAKQCASAEDTLSISPSPKCRKRYYYHSTYM